MDISNEQKTLCHRLTLATGHGDFVIIPARVY